MDDRIAIVVRADLSPGEAANVAGILCGQISRSHKRFFDAEPVVGSDRAAHAAPHFSVVVLKSKNASQLAKLAHGNQSALCFSRVGQGLNSAFATYKAEIEKLPLEKADLVAVAIFGADENVRQETRKFSLLR